ncbi:MAG: ornithine cyclodeaminase family protein [Bacteroidota bacterium]|nr:ornithine cyclodeaminase family protein [Bacteroidota bacterium]
MNYIDGQSVRSAVPYRSWVDAFEKAFQLEQDKDYLMPERTHVDFDNSTLLLMPCIAGRYFSTKLITLFTGNKKSGNSPLKGLVILNDREDGEPLAVLDGPAVTAMRTAAVGSYAVRHLSKPGSSKLGIIGLGIQGLHQALFACSERNIREVSIYDKNQESYPAFIRNFSTEYPDIKINKAKNNRELCEKAEIIITATNAREPVLPDDEKLLANKLIIGIGSYRKDMREFPDALYKLSGKIYVDTLHGLTESGDLIYPLGKGLLGRSDIIVARHLTRVKKEKTTMIFKSVGTALFDLVGSVLIYETLYMR